MYSGKTVGVIIAAAGSGTRMDREQLEDTWIY